MFSPQKEHYNKKHTELSFFNNTVCDKPMPDDYPTQDESLIFFNNGKNLITMYDV
jgi:hypothetical protein